MGDKELNQKLAVLVDAALAALREAEHFADEHKLSFDFSPEYGMGGTYVAVGSEDASWAENIGWNPSAHSC